MNQVFPSARVLLPAGASSFTLPDQDDVHVLQAAVVYGLITGCLLTFNLRDFLKRMNEKTQVEVIHPDDYHY